MEHDDIVYTLLLVSSILFGPVYSRLPRGSSRKITGTVVGASVVLLVAGVHALHLCVLLALNLLVISYAPARQWHGLSMLLSFVYLLLFRTISSVGYPEAPGHFNAVMMIATLKLVGLCGEMSDTVSNKEKLRLLGVENKSDTDETEVKTENGETSDAGTTVRKRRGSGEKKPSADCDLIQKELADSEIIQKEIAELQQKLLEQGVEPSLLDIVHYTLSYTGVLTGPYFKYRTWSDCVWQQHSVDGWAAALRRLRVVPVYAALFALTSHYFPLKYAESPAIFSRSLMYRLWYMTPVFFAFRMRLYTGFILSECVCIAAGLGAYPVESEARPGQGPTKLGVKGSSSALGFKTVHNIDEWVADFGPSVRHGMRGWNMTVQYWLVTNVYKRVQQPKAVKEALTMLVSAFWHGMHSGYYLSMLTVPFILMVEDYYVRLIRRRLCNYPKLEKIYDAVGWFLKMQWFAYMGMAFLLLRVTPTLHYWRSIGYLGHCSILALYTLAQFINLILGKAKDKVRRAQNTAFGSHSKLQVKPNQPLKRD